MAKNYQFWGLFLSTSVLLVLMPILEYNALHLGFYDTGIFQTWVHNIGEHGELGRMFFGHVQLAAFPYIAIVKFFPPKLDGAVLLALQSLMLIVPIVFFYRQYGLFVAACYCLYAPLWLNNHSEFHFDSLVVPLLIAFYFFILKQRLYWAALFAVLLMFIKEPFAFLTMGCGLFILIQKAANKTQIFCKKLTIVGLMVILLSMAYFYLVMSFVLPYFTVEVPPGFVFESSAFNWLGHSITQILFYIISHPIQIFCEIITTPDKLCYLFAIFGSLAFIPLLAPSYLIPALPLMLISLLSRTPNYYNYHNHYTVGLIIPVFFAFAHGLPKARLIWNQYIQPRFWWLKKYPPKLFYTLLFFYVLIGHIALSSSPFSWLFWSERVWSYHWRAYLPVQRDAMIKEAILKFVPKDKDVIVSAQNHINWYPLAHRETYNPFPNGIQTPISVIDWSQFSWDGFLNYVKTRERFVPPSVQRYADFVLLDLRRPWTIGDKNCRWYYNTCQDLSLAKEFLLWVNLTHRKYHVVFQQDDFIILERNNRLKNKHFLQAVEHS